MACFAPDEPVPARYAAAIEAMFQEAMLRYNGVTSWTSQGNGTTLSWSFVPDGVTIPSGVGEPASDSNLFATLDAQFNGDRARWIGRFEQSFQRWADLTGMDYVRITNGADDWDDGAGWGATGNANRGDVRIGMKFIGTSVLAYNSFPTNSDMVLDSADLWNSANEDRLFRNTIMHEHGHGLGFAHICPQASRSLMEPTLNTGFDGVQHDDVRGGQRLYGDPNEPDNSTGSATDLGILSPGAPASLGALPIQTAPGMPQPVFTSSLSIDANGEVDFFRFEIAAPSIIDFEIHPVGWRYDDSDQGGSCGSGNQIDSDEIADLAFQVLDSGGQTLFTSASATLGESEIISDLVLESAGVYYLRVYETNFPSESQLYSGQILVVDTAECLDAAACDDADPCTVDLCDSGRCVYLIDNDCNANGRDDTCEIAQGDALDCNGNGIPDSCEWRGVDIA
ncbi:MAG: matrixin family metalloprotease, partial [Planctomycetota bacterium]